MVLSKEKCISYNRYYLLFTGTASIFVPLINLPFSLFKANLVELGPIYELPVIISQITTFSQPEGSGSSAFLGFLVTIYVIGVIISLYFLISKLYKLAVLIRGSNTIIERNDFKIVLTNGKMPSFSFYKYVFLNEKDKTEEELSAIISHEQAHISQYHSVDLLLMEVYKIVFWFSPLTYRLAKDMRLNHEYLADQAVVKSIDKRDYINTLLNNIYLNTVSGVVHYFGLHSTEKRIKMIQKKISLKALYQPYFSIPFVSILFFTFSCHFEPVQILPTTIGNENTPKEFKSVMEELQANNPNRTYYFKFTSNYDLEKIKAKDFGSYTIDYFSRLKGYTENSFGIIYSFDDSRTLPEYVFSTNIYDLQEVNQIPTPWSGYEKILNKIDAKANQLVEVTVDKTIWVKFVVTTIGQITFTNISDTDYSKMSDNEAKLYGAAIKSINATSTDWRVGKINNTAVNVELELPVRFYKQK